MSNRAIVAWAFLYKLLFLIFSTGCMQLCSYCRNHVISFSSTDFIQRLFKKICSSWDPAKDFILPVYYTTIVLVNTQKNIFTSFLRKSNSTHWKYISVNTWHWLSTSQGSSTYVVYYELQNMTSVSLRNYYADKYNIICVFEKASYGVFRDETTKAMIFHPNEPSLQRPFNLLFFLLPRQICVFRVKCCRMGAIPTKEK